MLVKMVWGWAMPQLPLKRKGKSRHQGSPPLPLSSSSLAEFFTSAHKEYSVASKPSQPESSPAAPHGSQQGPPAAAEKAVSKVTKEPAAEDKDHTRCLEQPGGHITCTCASLGASQPATPSRTSPFSPSTTRTPLASSKGNGNLFGSRLWTQKRLGTGAATYWKRGILCPPPACALSTRPDGCFHGLSFCMRLYHAGHSSTKLAGI